MDQFSCHDEDLHWMTGGVGMLRSGLKSDQGISPGKGKGSDQLQNPGAMGLMRASTSSIRVDPNILLTDLRVRARVSPQSVTDQETGELSPTFHSSSWGDWEHDHQ